MDDMSNERRTGVLFKFRQIVKSMAHQKDKEHANAKGTLLIIKELMPQLEEMRGDGWTWVKISKIIIDSGLFYYIDTTRMSPKRLSSTYAYIRKKRELKAPKVVVLPQEPESVNIEQNNPQAVTQCDQEALTAPVTSETVKEDTVTPAVTEAPNKKRNRKIDYNDDGFVIRTKTYVTPLPEPKIETDSKPKTFREWNVFDDWDYWGRRPKPGHPLIGPPDRWDGLSKPSEEHPRQEVLEQDLPGYNPATEVKPQ